MTKARHEHLGEEERAVAAKLHKNGDGIVIYYDFEEPRLEYVKDSPSKSKGNDPTREEGSDFLASFVILLMTGMLKPTKMPEFSNSQIFTLSDVGIEVTMAFTN